MPLTNDSKKNAATLADHLDVVGQEDEKKGAKWTIEVGEEERKMEQKIKDTQEEILQDARRRRRVYTEQLLKDWENVLTYWASELPPGASWKVKPTEQGILFTTVSGGKTYKRATKIEGTAKYDRNTIYRFVTQILTLLDDGKEKSRIWIPPTKTN